MGVSEINSMATNGMASLNASADSLADDLIRVSKAVKTDAETGVNQIKNKIIEDLEVIQKNVRASLGEQGISINGRLSDLTRLVQNIETENNNNAELQTEDQDKIRDKLLHVN